MEPKEPLIAVLLTFIFSGLGQMYSGKVRRGFAIIGINLGLCLAFLSVVLYIINPHTRFNTMLIVFLIVLAILGAAWGISIIVDAYRCAKSFNNDNNLKRKISFGKKTLIFLGIVIVLFIPSFDAPMKAYIKNNIVQAFLFPSGSMEPTIQKGDRLLADKAIYKKSKPQRGDLIVFKFPPDPKWDFLKRVIALGGETVEIKEGDIYINGQLCSDVKIRDRYYYNRGDYGQMNNPVTVPDGQYYVLGDNSAYSQDSRYWGFVPDKNIVGKIYKIYWPVNRSGAVE